MRRWITVTVLLLAAALIVTGLVQAQNRAVARKAETICLECVGIG